MTLRSKMGPRTNKALLLLSVSLLSLCLVEPAIALRRSEMASFMSPTSYDGQKYFAGGDFIFAGGVVLRGRAVFLEDKKQINVNQLNLQYSRTDQLKGGSVAVIYQGKSFALEIPERTICPLAQFVNRDGIIAFTVPVVAFDADYFAKNNLIESNEDDYVAKEFFDAGLADFLEKVDLDTLTVPLEREWQTKIKTDINGKNGGAVNKWVKPGTYVNADFHITYQALLVEKTGRLIVDIAGLPLRYHWDVGSNGAILNKIEIYAFPQEKQKLHYEAVLFFQNAAIFRQFKLDKPADFNRFASEACEAAR